MLIDVQVRVLEANLATLKGQNQQLGARLVSVLCEDCMYVVISN
jgi:hypothetical protein